jgi:hypothetical protein
LIDRLFEGDVHIFGSAAIALRKSCIS